MAMVMSETRAPPQKIGLFGGAFDPFHLGHFRVATAARQQLELDQVILVPTYVPPHKPPPTFNFEQRLEMLTLLCEEHDWLSVSDIERHLPCPSYSLQTLQSLISHQPGTWVMILGADAFCQFHQWHEWQTLQSLCKIAVFQRECTKVRQSDMRPPDVAPPIWLKGASVSIRSTDIRQHLEAGLPIHGQVPEVIEHWIQRHYQN